MSSPSPEPTECPPDVNPNGLVTVASLRLRSFLASGFGPAGPPPGLLAQLTYSVREGRLHVTFPPDLLDGIGGRMGGGEYKDQLVVGWKAGIDTRPGDYVTYGSSSHPFVPGDHPLAEADADEREVGTTWEPVSEADRAAMAERASRADRVDAQGIPERYRWPVDGSLPLDEGERDECGCPVCRGGGAQEDGADGRWGAK